MSNLNTKKLPLICYLLGFVLGECLCCLVEVIFNIKIIDYFNIISYFNIFIMGFSFYLMWKMVKKKLK
jgi:hypothetical protein